MGRYITTTGTAAPVVKEVSAGYSAVVNDRILADTAVAPFVIQLPANATLFVNDTIQIIDVGKSMGTNPVTLSRNGSLIMGLAEDLELDMSGSITTIMYSGTTYGWIIIGT